MKKYIIITILFSLLIFPAHAGNYIFSVSSHLPLSRDIVYPGYTDKVSEIDGISITARSVVVMDAKTGNVIYSINPLLKSPIASLTKIMSLIVFIGSGKSLYDTVEVEDGDSSKLNKYVDEGDVISQLQLVVGDKMYVKDAVYSGLIRSANNAVSMFARSSGLSEEEFVTRMNEYAKSLRMNDTNFTETTGLDPKNVSTALDMAKLARHAFKNGFIRRVTTTQSYSFETILNNLYYRAGNTNKLLTMMHPVYYEVVGGKTGYLEESRYNIVTQIKNWQGKEVIVVIFGSETSQKRFDETKSLAIKAFEKIE